MVGTTDVLVVRPHHGIGPMTLGVSDEGMRRALAALPGCPEPDPSSPGWADFESGMSVEYELEGDPSVVRAIEVWRPVDAPDVVLEGVSLFSGSAREVLSRIAGLGFVSTERGYLWVSDRLDVGLTIEDGRVAAVLVGVPGYYAPSPPRERGPMSPERAVG